MANKSDATEKNCSAVELEHELNYSETQSDAPDDEEKIYENHGSEIVTNAGGKLNNLLADLCMISERKTLPYSNEHGNYSKRTTLASSNSNEDNQSTTSTINDSQPHLHHPTQNSTFSFKHFLNSNCTTGSCKPSNSFDTPPVVVNNVSSENGSLNSLQTSTGARPKVHQSDSISTTSISSLIGVLPATGIQESTMSKMKRSPRFSSFDSQASLAEYAGIVPEEGAVGGKETTNAGFQLYSETLNSEDSDYFSGAPNAISINSNDKERRYVPRSFSSYDMPVPPSSPRRRIITNTTYNNERPNRLALQTNSNKLKLDLPIDTSNNINTSRGGLHNGSDFLTAAAAAALPDFVQDHWMDSWYAHDMHLNSPPNSPICDIVVDLTGAAGCSGSNIGCGRTAPNTNSTSNNNTNEQPSSSKMLPDFLSDGPIIHSSQRLADVAAGLPSNSVGSPESCSVSSQMSRLRTENDHMQRELNEVRCALNEQTKRANDLENQLKERTRQESVQKQYDSQLISLEEDNLNKSKRRTIAAQKHVTKLKQQVTQLTAEVETLRRENETLREEGAVGGCNVASDRPLNSSAFSNQRSNIERPSRTQQISRDLLRAATNAENNLRQLLAGVDNLRQMAANIEKPETSKEYDASPDLFSEFLDDCDDYEDYTGGPAL